MPQSMHEWIEENMISSKEAARQTLEQSFNSVSILTMDIVMNKIDCAIQNCQTYVKYNYGEDSVPQATANGIVQILKHLGYFVSMDTYKGEMTIDWRLDAEYIE